MVDSSSLWTFAVLSLAIIVVPGPSVLFVVGRAVAHGRRAALLTVAGNAAGAYVQVLLVAAGLGVVVERSVAAFTTVKLLGAGYLVWLGLRAVRERRSAARLALAAGDAGPGTTTPREGRGTGSEGRRPRSAATIVREGFVVGVANPKLIVFFAAFLPQFVAPGGGPVPLQMALLGIVFVVIALVSDGAWGLAAGTARAWFAGDQRRLERLGIAGGATMIGLGIHLAVTGRAD